MATNGQLGKYTLFLFIILLSSCISHRDLFLCNNTEKHILIEMVDINGLKDIDTLNQCDCKSLAAKAIGRVIFKIEETQYQPAWHSGGFAKIYSNGDTIYVDSIESLLKLDDLTKNEKGLIFKKCNIKKENNVFVFLE